MDRLHTIFSPVQEQTSAVRGRVLLGSPAHFLAINAGLALLYIIAALLGLQFAVANQSVTVIWPPTGIAIAAIFLLGHRALPGVAVGAFIANLLTGASLPAAALIAFGNMLESATALGLLQWAGFRPSFERMWDAFAFTILAAGISTFVSAGIGTTALYLSGSAQAEQVFTVFTQWWLGDALGALVIAPLILVWATTPLSQFTRLKALEAGAILLSMLALTVVVLASRGDFSQSRAIGYLAFPALVWVSLRFARREVVTVSFLTSVMTVVSLAMISQYSPENLAPQLEATGPFLAAISITALLLSATLAERQGEAQQAERARGHFARIFELNPSAITITTLDDGRYVDANQSFLDIVGYSRQELIGKSSFADLPIWQSLDDRQRMLEMLRTTGHVRDFATCFRAKSGELREVLISLEEIELEDGRYLLGMVLDQTEQKQAEQTLRQSEARFRAIFENSPIGIGFGNGTGGHLFVNPAYTRMLGYTQEELQNLNWRDYTHPDDIAADEAFSKQLTANKIPSYQIEKRYLHKSGEVIWGRATITAMPDYETGIYRGLSLIEDITERKQAEVTLRQSEARFRAIFENAPIGISFTNEQEDQLYINQAIADMLGYTQEELLALHWSQITHPEDVSADAALLARLDAGEIQGYQLEKRFLHKSGETIWGRLTVTHIPNSGEGGAMRLALIEDIRERKLAEAAMHMINITLEERVQERTLELEAANARLTELDRMKSRFIADVSHELRTPLSVLNTRVYLLERSGEDKRAEYLQGLREQIERLSQFVTNVLDLSRIEGDRHQLVMQPLALNPLVSQVVESLRPRAEDAGLELRWQAGAELRPIRGNSERLGQVITNLVSNALKYTRAGHVSITTGLEPSGERAWLRVEDTGIGIPPEDLPHIFDRFYRAQNVSQLTIAGTGLGLSITKEIVEMHGGEIALESTVGVGTTVTVWLPLAAGR
jgi:PAS domain S-box-containing protein